MPYPNEHACRLLDPKEWIVVGSEEREHKGKKYRVLFARKKGESGSKEQAYRYPLKNGWSAAEARSHCKDHHGSFEPAKESKHSESDIVSEFTGQKRGNKAPVEACIFSAAETVSAAANVDQDKSLKIMGYSGGIIKDHWFWGDVIFDLQGIKFAKARTPILHEHFTRSRIGFTTKQDINNKVNVEGQFLDNEEARALRNDMIAGFPMEASLYVPPLVIENVKADERVEINGLTFKGPGTIFRKSVIREISVCVLGADAKTKSAAYSESDSKTIAFSIKENEIMAKEEEQMTVAMFTEQWPDIHAEVFNAGKAEGLAEGHEKLSNLFKEVQVACGGDSELLVACFTEGKTVEQAYKMRADKLQAANKQLGEDLVKARKAKVDPAIQEFTQGGPPPVAKFDEVTATDAQLNEHFAQTQQVQDEYGDVQAYLAYVRHNVRKK